MEEQHHEMNEQLSVIKYYQGKRYRVEMAVNNWTYSLILPYSQTIYLWIGEILQRLAIEPNIYMCVCAAFRFSPCQNGFLESFSELLYIFLPTPLNKGLVLGVSGGGGGGKATAFTGSKLFFDYFFIYFILNFLTKWCPLKQTILSNDNHGLAAFVSWSSQSLAAIEKEYHNPHQNISEWVLANG